MTDINKIKLFSNQKMVQIHKTKSDKNNLYAIVNIDALMKAMNELSKNEMKIYLSMLANANGYAFAYSPEDISQKTGANKRDLQRCFNTLTDKKYFVQSKNNKKLYHFFENPDDYSRNFDPDTDADKTYVDSENQCDDNVSTNNTDSREDSSYLHDNQSRFDYDDNTRRNNTSRKTKENKSNTEKSESNSSTETENISYTTKRKVIEMFKKGSKYNEIKALTALTGKQIHEIITEYKKHGRILDLSIFGDDKKILDANGNETNYTYGNFQIPPENAQIDFSEDSLFSMFTDCNGDYRFDKNLVAKWFVYLQSQ